MKRVWPSDQKWFFSADGHIEGFCTGSTDSIEHQSGINFILDRLCRDRDDSEGFGSFRVTNMDRRLRLYDDGRVVALYFGAMDFEHSHHGRLTRTLFFERYDDNWPYVSWGSEGFVIAARHENDRKYVDALRSLHASFLSGSLLLGRGTPSQDYDSGIIFHLVPPREQKASETDEPSWVELLDKKVSHG